MGHFVTEYILPIIGSAVGIMLTIASGYAIRWLSNKTGIDIRKEKVDIMDKAITEAVWSAEEKTAAVLKPKIEKIMDNVKLAPVLNFIGNQFPELTHEEADTKVHAIIGMTPGLGASGDVQKKEVVQIVTELPNVEPTEIIEALGATVNTTPPLPKSKGKK